MRLADLFLHRRSDKQYHCPQPSRLSHHGQTLSPFPFLFLSGERGGTRGFAWRFRDLDFVFQPFLDLLHRYPSDADKHLLARQTGLSRNQVSPLTLPAMGSQLCDSHQGCKVVGRSMSPAHQALLITRHLPDIKLQSFIFFLYWFRPDHRWVGRDPR